MVVATQLFVFGLYLPPVFSLPVLPWPPRRPYQSQSTPPCDSRALGAPTVVVAIQLSVLGLYLPPVLKEPGAVSAPDDHLSASPHCGMKKSPIRRAGGGSWEPNFCARNVSAATIFGVAVGLKPPQTIISVPVHTAV